MTSTSVSDPARSAPSRPASGRPLPTRGGVPVLAALVALVVLAAGLAGPWRIGVRDVDVEIPSVQMTAGTPPPVVEEDPPPPSDLGEPPVGIGWITVLVTVMAALLLVYLLLRVARRLRQSDRAADEEGDELDAGELVDVPELDAPALREAVQQAGRELVDDVPPGDAVIAAWMTLEQAAARVGVVRDPAQTAGELTVQVLDATRADPLAVRELLALYLAARYGSHPVTTGDVERARDALALLADGLQERAASSSEAPAEPVAGESS